MSKSSLEDVEWYCDNCGTHLNHQQGFNVDSGIWVCHKCGFKNDVTDNNILDDDLTDLILCSYVTCPICYAHMKREGINTWYCLDCGCVGEYDYLEEKLVNYKSKLKKG